MSARKIKPTEPARPFWKRHSLSLAATGILALCLVFYLRSELNSHAAVLSGNAVADWTGVVITILATKWFFEKGSRESRQPRRTHANRLLEMLHEHSLTIFLLVTGLAWVALFVEVDPASRWGSVVGSLVSEWSQQIGLVVLTKRFFEIHSKEGSDER